MFRSEPKLLNLTINILQFHCFKSKLAQKSKVSQNYWVKWMNYPIVTGVIHRNKGIEFAKEESGNFNLVYMNFKQE